MRLAFTIDDSTWSSSTIVLESGGCVADASMLKLNGDDQWKRKKCITTSTACVQHYRIRQTYSKTSTYQLTAADQLTIKTTKCGPIDIHTSIDLDLAKSIQSLTEMIHQPLKAKYMYTAFVAFSEQRGASEHFHTS